MSKLQERLERAERIARNTFGYADGLRPTQVAVLKPVLERRDTMAIIPTGGGKSATYQIPSLIFKGTTIVFSPLIALMKDQFGKLKEWGVSAAKLSGDMEDDESARVVRRLSKYKIVFAAPERLKSSEFLRALRDTKINLITIDEAHMIHQAQKDFRPAYALMGKVIREDLKGIPLLVLTATADPEIETDIARTLGMRGYSRVIVPAERPNLNYEVVHEMDNTDIAQLISQRNTLAEKGSSVLLYAATRKKVETLATDLNTCGLKASFYHGGMDAKTRTEVQEAFMRGKSRVMVATNAFGMGVDSPAIRMVVHAEIPGSFHDWQQEAGRCSRDGQPGFCILNVTKKGLQSRRRLIKIANPPMTWYDHIWEKWEEHATRETFLENVSDIVESMCRLRCSHFEAPGYCDSVLSYLEYNGAITTLPDKTIYYAEIRNKAILMGFYQRHRKNIRLTRGGKAAVTIFPNGEDIMPSLLRGGAVTLPDFYRPHRYLRIMKRRSTHNVTEAEIIRKREQAQEKLDLLLDFTQTEDRHGFIRRVYARPAKG